MDDASDEDYEGWQKIKVSELRLLQAALQHGMAVTLACSPPAPPVTLSKCHVDELVGDIPEEIEGVDSSDFLIVVRDTGDTFEVDLLKPAKRPTHH